MQPNNAPAMATAGDIADLERHEVVGGEIVEKAAPSFEHSASQARIAGALYGFWGRDGRGRPGGWWLGTEAEIELAPHDVYLADVAGWRVERVPQPPSGRPVRIAPDWVCEILSPSTAARDLGVKQRGYHRGHVGHYWIISPVERTLQVLRWTERGYLVAMAAGPGEVVRAEPFEAIELDISDIFGLPPRDGR